MEDKDLQAEIMKMFQDNPELMNQITGIMSDDKADEK